jgi:integrase
MNKRVSARNEKVRVKIAWGHLRTNPADPTFLDRRVSVPTTECPQGSRVLDDVWHFPASLASSPAAHLRRINFKVLCGNGFLTDPQFEPLLQFCKRFAIAKMKHPLKGAIKLPSVKRHLTLVFDLVDCVASGPWIQGRTRLADLNLEDVRGCVTEMSLDWRQNAGGFEALRRVFKEIQDYGKRGLLGDWFEAIPLADIKKLCACHWEELKRGQMPADRSLFTTPPLPDLYCFKTVEIGGFYNNVLANPIIDNVRELARLRREEADILQHEPMTIWDPRRARVRFEEFARDYVWPVRKLPFEVSYEFPPRTSGELIPVLGTLQSANIQMTALETGARDGEILNMGRDCLVQKRAASGEGTIKSLRFKNSPDMGGEDVEWDVSERVVRAIENQLALAEAMGSPAVWGCVHWSDFGKRLTGGINDWLQRFADRHFLDAELGNRKVVSIQRFRTTLARFVMLAEGGHPRLVKRLLGHSNIATTIAYIRMSPYIQAELAHARRMRLAPVISADVSPDPDVTTIPGKLSAEALASIVTGAARLGKPVRLLGPGVFFSQDACVGAHDPRLAAFCTDGVRRDAFAFAVQQLCGSDVRSRRDLFQWFVEQARLIDTEYHAGEIYVPVTAREGAVYDLIKRKDVEHGS